MTSTLKIDTIEPEGATTTLTVGESGQNTVIAGAGIKANVVKDAGANAIFTSNGSGSLSGLNSGLGGAWTLLQSQTASGDASISFTSGIDSTYDEYIVDIVNVHPSTGSEVVFYFQCSTDGGSNYNTTVTNTAFNIYHRENDATATYAYAAGMTQAQGTAFISMSNTSGVESDRCMCHTLHLYDLASTTYVKNYIFQSQLMDGNTPAFSQWDGAGGYFNTTSAINAIQFKFASGNIDAGTLKLYGVK